MEKRKKENKKQVVPVSVSLSGSLVIERAGYLHIFFMYV